MREKAKQMSEGKNFLGREKNKYKGSQARVFGELESVGSREANMNDAWSRKTERIFLTSFFLYLNLTCQNNNHSKSSLLIHFFLLQ